jgi:hypothetical protein
MNPDLSTILSLRRVLESTKEGKGVARSLVEEMGRMSPLGRTVARLILLGYPLQSALSPLVEGNSQEVSMLSSLLGSAPRSSATLVGRNGEAFSHTLERWVKVRENRILEQKVFRFRSILASGVLGAVTAMISSLGPVVGNLSLSGGAPVDASALAYAAAAMTIISSGMLGLFMSGRRFFVNIAVSLAVFALVSLVAAPLANVPSVDLWGVK